TRSLLPDGAEIRLPDGRLDEAEGVHVDLNRVDPGRALHLAKDVNHDVGARAAHGDRRIGRIEEPLAFVEDRREHVVHVPAALETAEEVLFIVLGPAWLERARGDDAAHLDPGPD